jgi:hypothetical protein
MTPTFGIVGPPWWADKTVFLIGGGPSLRGFDLRRLFGRGHLVGINESMFHVPVVAGVSVDLRFVSSRFDRLAEFAKTTQLFLSLGAEWWNEVDPVPSAVNLWNSPLPGISHDPALLRRGSTSGYAALNLAVLKRARHIVLLGYDYRNIGGLKNFHDGYSWRPVADALWADWAREFTFAADECKAAGVSVVNASPASMIGCFTKMTIDEALQ